MSRTFTVEQANRMLPLVRRIVEDIVSHYADWQQVVGEFEVATATMGTSGRALELQRAAERLASDIEHFVRELRDLGVEFKGFDLGLVDFPSERDGRPVLLCWKLNEPSVAYWHELEAGFAGRQPLATEPPVLEPNGLS